LSGDALFVLRGGDDLRIGLWLLRFFIRAASNFALRRGGPVEGFGRPR